MTRLAIIAPKATQHEIIQALHDSQLAHIEEYSKGEDPDLDIGDPLEEASEGSETLVRIRGILHTLDVDEEPSRQLTQDEIHARLPNELPGIEEEVEEASSHRDEIRRELESLRDRLSQLEPLEDLPMRLEDYGGYETIEVFVGTAPEDLTDRLGQAIERFEYFASEDAHAVFVHEDEADKAQEILTREGFREMELPEGEGTIRENKRRLQRQMEELEAELTEADAELERLTEDHKDLLLCAEEDLSIEVEKAEAPLDFASTERAFIVDTWVPTQDLDELKTEVSRAAGGRVAFEKLDEGQREVHGREAEPPTRYDHPTGVAPFSVLLDVFSPPKYDEIDPTIILSIVFPLFFGFMIGDFGYGILMVALGLFLYRRVGQKSEEARGLGFALLVSGIWATLFGFFIFQDALGIPVLGGGHGGGLSWEGLLGIHVGFYDALPHGMFIHKIESPGVKTMLALSILAAFVHLFIGFIFGFINELSHSKKHAAAQIGWIGVLVGFFLLTLVAGPQNRVSDFFLRAFGDPGVATSGYFLGPGVLILLLTEGPMGIMETFSLLSNMISYTRLAGVGVAKGAMAVAFNGIFLDDMVLHGSGVLIAVGLVLFVLAQMIVFVLGLISSSIQSIRLNYVEFFLKFYEGGGEPFEPFGRLRKYTVPSTTD